MELSLSRDVAVSDLILAVDLDGTLLKSDMLHETFWSALGQSWRNVFTSFRALAQGRAVLKRHLAAAARIDPATLPYNEDVLDYVRNWRQEGGRTALVTASDQALADSIASHLDLFDEVHGSDGNQNLKGKCKAEFLDDRFGSTGFAYMGDSYADIAVWEISSLAITVSADAALRAKAEQAAGVFEHISPPNHAMRAYAKALRPHQWLKNTLVFLPMIAAHQLDWNTLATAMLAFISFSVIASSVYILNDLIDLDSDRQHPRKRNRPFAAGTVPIAHGAWMGGGLMLAGGALAAILGPEYFAIMLSYLLMTTAYSLFLKRVMVADICVLAGLYTIRIFAGGVATENQLSVWMLAFSIFFFLSLAAVKRQAELVDSADRGKLQASGRGYTVDDLPIISMIAIAAGYLSVLVMALYVNSPNVVELYSRPNFLWGISGVLLYWLTRTVFIAHRGGMHDDPVVYAVKDKVSLGCFAVILGLGAAAAV